MFERHFERKRAGWATTVAAIALLAGPAPAALTPMALPGGSAKGTAPARSAPGTKAAPAAVSAETAKALWAAMAAPGPVGSASGRNADARGADTGAPAIRSSKALHESGIPETPRESTAAPVVAASMAGTPRNPTDPLPVYRPTYPYGGTQAGQAVEPVRTLAEAIALAYRTNPKLAAERATLRGVDLRVPGARAAYGPTLDLQASYGLTHDKNDTIFNTQTDQSGWASSAAATLTQPVLTFGRNRAGESIAHAQVDYTRDQLRLVESEVMLGVVSAYVGVIRDANGVSIARQNAAILEKEWRDDAARYKVREITQTDLQQVENRYASAQAQLIQSEGQLAASQAQFLRVIGAPPGELAAPDVLTPPAQTLDAAMAIADVESPVIRAAQSREKISRGNLEAAKAEWMPRVDFKGTAAIGTLTPYTDLQRTHRLQAELVATVPVLDSGKRWARTGEARENNQADWLLIDQALRDTRAGVAQAWDQMTAQRASLEYYLKAVDAARQAYEGGRIEERAGARTTLEVLDLARDLLFVQQNYNTALANEYLSRANLLAAMGRLEAPRLVPDIKAYDAKSHYRRKAWIDDLPLFTPVMRTLDGVMFGPVSGDRPIRDAGSTVQTTAPMPLAPESAAVPVDPTANLSAKK